MRELNISLLWPREKNEFSSMTAALSSATVSSLEIDLLCTSVSQNEADFRTVKGILTELCHDEEVISYRQEIFDDFLSSEKLINAFEEILYYLGQLEYASVRTGVPEESKLWQLFSRFKELEGYVDCVMAIIKTMRDIPLRSRGLLAFRERAELLSKDADFITLTSVVKSLNLELNEIQSITLGINLDSRLNPEEAMLVSVNNTRFKENHFLRDVISYMSAGNIILEELGVASKLHRASDDRRDPIMYVLYKDLEKCLRPVVKDLANTLNRYANVHTNYMAGAKPEIIFYLSFARLHKMLIEQGMPCCRPVIAKTSDRICNITDAYSVNLCMHLRSAGRDSFTEIVKNRVTFGNEGRVLIITGPNRGGKTVYTQTVGLAQVLFQAGVFVPGVTAEISPVDNIFSHFPTEESQTAELGRLGEETKRLGNIFREATQHSLILLNESLTSTSYSEGLYLAQEVVRAIRYLGARAIFNTHLHALAEGVDALNAGTHGDSLIVSMITGIVDGQRSYIVEPGAPLGKSYAMDIAIKFGVSFEQITGIIDKKMITCDV